MPFSIFKTCFHTGVLPFCQEAVDSPCPQWPALLCFCYARTVRTQSCRDAQTGTVNGSECTPFKEPLQLGGLWNWRRPEGSSAALGPCCPGFRWALPPPPIRTRSVPAGLNPSQTIPGERVPHWAQGCNCVLRGELGGRGMFGFFFFFSFF